MVNNVVSELQNARVMNKEAALKMKLEGTLAEAVAFIERNQITDVGMWQKCVQVFREHIDGDTIWKYTWRSEFWGKMMRGAAMVVKYTQDDGMYRILEASVRDILTTADEQGRISGYSLEQEFTRWDLWGRKYVMLGMMYFMEICRDEALNAEMLAAMRRHADYIVAHVGGENGPDIRTCSKHWEGMNSCSILEPMVRLYRLTGDKKYLDFAEYIISTGFIQSANLVELAYADEVTPHEYPVVKAYEMMSCFEGLLQYYYVTGVEKYKTALLNFGRRIMEGEISIIGCSGCTHELFDHTAVRQTQTDYEGIVQETCVTVTWMKFAMAMLELSGDVAYADHIEQSYYNAYIGAFNTHRVARIESSKEGLPQVLPFDSYSPLVSNLRGRKVGGYNIFTDKTYYGCCACIGAAGAGTFPQVALMKNEKGLVFNLYEQGTIEALTPAGKALSVQMDTAYPYDGKIKLTLTLEAPECFDLTFRVPAWCEGATLTAKGKTDSVAAGYATVSAEWQSGDVIELNLPMAMKRVLPPEGAVNADVFAAYTYGPLVMAADKRITDPDAVLDIAVDEKGYAASKAVYCPEIRDAHLCLEVALTSGEKVRLIDYASAGKTWTEESRCAAWLYRKPLAE
ncbi:MAG: glycoside hydrolase family 127 protein [Clostridia bacterium]|nr:glycoside hydrolase family 127 protein [Clostridia bacterium]